MRTAFRHAVALLLVCVPQGPSFAKEPEAQGDCGVRIQTARPPYFRIFGPATMASDGSSGVILVWSEVPGLPVYAQRVDRNGRVRWMDGGLRLADMLPFPFISYPFFARPDASSDGSGGVVAVWLDERDFKYTIVAQRADADGVRRWGPDGVVISSASLSSYPVSFPRIASDGGGGAFVGWSFAPVRAQHLDSAGNPLWGNGGVSVTPDASSFLAALVPDDAGGVFVVLLGLSGGFGPVDIRVQRLDPTGKPLWGPGGVRFATVVSYNLGLTSPIPDGQGGMIAAWQEWRSGLDWDIYAQRVDASGNVLWTDNGVPVCKDFYYNQTNPVAAADGHGGAVVAWQDERLTPNKSRIYAQHVSPTGAPLWALNGIPVSNATQGEWVPVVTVERDGASVIAWNDSRETSPRVFAQRLDAAGAPQWLPGGLEICPSGSESQPLVAPGKEGGTIIAWVDGGLQVQFVGRDGSTPPQWTPDTEGATASPVDAVSSSGTLISGQTVARSEGLALAIVSRNPAQSGVLVRYVLPEVIDSRLVVYDVTGKEVRLLESGTGGAGEHLASWDGRGPSGRRVAPGVYFVRLSAGPKSVTTRIALTP